MKVVTLPNSLPAHKKELDKRLKYYADNPEDLLDWLEVKNDW